MEQTRMPPASCISESRSLMAARTVVDHPTRSMTTAATDIVGQGGKQNTVTERIDVGCGRHHIIDGRCSTQGDEPDEPHTSD